MRADAWGVEMFRRGAVIRAALTKGALGRVMSYAEVKADGTMSQTDRMNRAVRGMVAVRLDGPGDLAGLWVWCEPEDVRALSIVESIATLDT